MAMYSRLGGSIRGQQLLKIVSPAGGELQAIPAQPKIQKHYSNLLDKAFDPEV
jgi:hypothetical protein